MPIRLFVGRESLRGFVLTGYKTRSTDQILVRGNQGGFRGLRRREGRNTGHGLQGGDFSLPLEGGGGNRLNQVLAFILRQG